MVAPMEETRVHDVLSPLKLKSRTEPVPAAPIQCACKKTDWPFRLIETLILCSIYDFKREHALAISLGNSSHLPE